MPPTSEQGNFPFRLRVLIWRDVRLFGGDVAQMPLLGVLVFAAAIACAIHAGKTGRPQYWIYILILVPGLGTFAYVLFELVPEWMNSYQGRKTARSVGRLVDPEGTYRALRDAVETGPTVETMSKLAEECIELRRFDEAASLYGRCLQGMHASDPHLLLGLARAQFGTEQFDAAKATLDRLRAENPGFQSADGHLLYARALEGLGDFAAARGEFEALIGYFPGPEATCRYALMLQKLGETQRAQAMFADIKRRLDRSPRHVRKMQEEWYAIASRNA